MTGAELLIIAAIAGGTATAIGQIEQGRAAKAQGKAEEKIAQFNALQKEKEAKSRMEAARLEEEKVSRREKIFKAEQRVRFPKGGVTLAGSPLDFLAETAGEFATERALTLREGLIQSGQLKSQASILRAGGKLSAQLGKSRQKASFLQAGGTILSTASTVGSIKGSKQQLIQNPHGLPSGEGLRPDAWRGN
jgi:hypothetical protein